MERVNFKSLRNHYETQGRESCYNSYYGHWNLKTAFFKRRREIICSMLPKGDGLAIDLGCGLGVYSHDMLKRGFKVVSVDISRSYLEKAKRMSKKLKFNHVHFILADAQSLPFRNSIFCLVLCSEVLEHLPNYLKGLQEIIRILKSKGVLVLSIPSSFSFTEILLRSKEHLHKINPVWLKNTLKTSGFSITNEKYCNFVIKPIIDLKLRFVKKYLMLHLWICLDRVVGKIPFIKLFCWCYVLKAYKDLAEKLKC